jgi:hypothetical protein
LGQNQIVSALFEGTLRDIEESGFLGRTALAESFGDIGRNGNGRVSFLLN